VLLASAVWFSGTAAAGGLLVKLGVRDGPYLREEARFDIHAAFRVFKHRDFRLQALGYFGHMWELNAFWSLASFYLAASFAKAARPSAPAVPPLVFVVIAGGAAGCVLAGWASRRFGERTVALVSLAGSFAFCALSGFLYDALLVVLLPAIIVWGVLVVADSPMFSSLAARTCPPEYTGTALTIQNGIGFAVTVAAILFIAWVSRLVGWRWAFTFLAVGPALGAAEAIGGATYARGANIAALYRIAPRALLNAGKLRLAGEVEWTAAAYGTPDGNGVVKDAKWVGNLRLLGAVYYFF